MSGRMEGKLVAVTGAGSGIGRAIAERMVAEGATVALGDVVADAVVAVADTLGPAAMAGVLDITVENDVEAFFARVVNEHGPLDATVHCAGTGSPPAPLVHTTAETWRHVIEVNLTGTMLVLKHAARSTADGGAITAIASLNATQPAHGMAPYVASKAGVAMLVEVAALELGARRVRVNAIAPGLVDTPLVGPLLEPEVLREFLENTPLGRHGQTSDIADAAVFLSDSSSSWITGTLLAVNGGAHLRRYPDLLTLMGAQQA